MPLRAVQVRGTHLSEHWVPGQGQGCWGGERPPGLRLVSTRTTGAGGRPQQRSADPHPTPPCLFSPAPLALAGRPLTTSCSRSQLIGTLLSPPLGVSPSCHARFQRLRALLLVRIVYICLLARVRGGVCDEEWVVRICICKSVTSLRQKGENCS